MNDKLEQIKNILASHFGLTDEWQDGTYLYHLTRVKSAFHIGTMTLDDFVEVDEEFLDEVFEGIKPVVEDLQKQIEQQQQKIKRLQEIADELNNKLFSERMTIEKLEWQLKQAQEEIERLEIRYEFASQIEYELRQEIRQLQRQLQKVRGNISETLEALKRGGPGTRSQVQRLLEEVLEGEE